MDNEVYELFFRELGIPVEPLPDNYTPDSFARRLLSARQSSPREVAYAAKTDYVADYRQGTSSNYKN